MDRPVVLRVALAAAVVAAAAAALLAVAIVPAGERAAGGARASAPGRAGPPIRPSRAPVPILMYHAIRSAPPGARLPSLFVHPAEFAAEVGALRGAGYHAVTLQRVWDAWRGAATLPRRPVVLSFDDGYPSQLRIALPVLRRVGWRGVLNLALGYVDEIGGQAAIRRLVDAGWEIDSHSRTHADLTRVPADQLRDETAGARAELTRRFGVQASFFCYPSGRYDTRVVAAVRQAGYLAATTVRLGYARRSDRFTLARVRVDAGLGAAGLLRRLRALRPAAAS
jgi:peptidoglycan/xylan/chitin deacetylase (PgdA/CDA1 family)